MSPTVWVIVAMLYTPDGVKKRYEPKVEFPDSTSCIAATDRINREWLNDHKGWAMCLPKDMVDK